MPALEVIDPGLQTTVQDYPGRRGLQALGFFPAGPADHLAFRVANVLVGNRPGAAALEIPLGRFQATILYSGLLAICGAPGVEITVNGRPVPAWESIPVSTGDLLHCGIARGPGFRLYLALSGGIAVPEVFGSRSTFLVGGIGGLDGRALAKADVLDAAADGVGRTARRRVPRSLRPAYTDAWEIEVLRGPHADPDYLTVADYDELLSTAWRVDLNSDRAATRLNPHRFRWAREGGDDAGGHPSNLLDGSYPVGGILAYGDVLTILGPDSHTSGGFAVVATIAHASLWKVGQLRPGRDTVRLREIDLAEAEALAAHTEFILDPRHLEHV
ncbi:biotin-dependent carboxyltransferase family protein [Pseudonocardia sp. H11422]|uniref:biotin-dependent carboxyltransferase family protein n=1 Tax=Pseudonocardia sp. H11422 TaxID=2835866 RepID=UPI001BDCFE95|nr:biotin-dependent carboxyltransferase family protein [Pseudonocardia sp. H11422]